MPDPQFRLEAEGIVTTGVWTDITSRINRSEEITVDTGRQTELADIDPSRLGLSLRNADGAFNPRNPSSPYPGWEPGRRLRLTETVGGVDYPLITGYLETPEVTVNTPGRSQPVTISAVDLLGRLSSAPEMLGTLTEYILAEQAGGLVEYFPLTDATLPALSMINNTSMDILPELYGELDTEPSDLIRPAQGDAPPGDDGRYMLWQYGLGGDHAATSRLVSDVSFYSAPGDTISLTGWLYPTPPPSISTTFYRYPLWMGGIDSAGTSVYISAGEQSSFNKIFTGTFRASDAVTDLPSRLLEDSAWRLISIQVDLGAGTLALWIGLDLAVSTSLAATPTGSVHWTSLDLGLLYEGVIAQLQVRVGPSGTWTRAMHIAQHQHGHTGLHRQTVAERITTIARYAGVDPADLDLPASASTPLQPAQFGGRTPSAAIHDTARSGQDTAVVNGLGKLTLLPRSQRYGQPATLQIPWGWLEHGGVKYRPDRAINTVTVSRSGGSTRRVDRASQLARGVGSTSVDIGDTDVPDDAPNLASWLLRTLDQTRTRCSLLRISMLRRTIAHRQALLSLRIGDRIQLTGMPADSPDDVAHLIVHGIRHIIGPGRKRIFELKTGPLLGPSPGVPPACPHVGDLVSPSAIIAY